MSEITYNKRWGCRNCSTKGKTLQDLTGLDNKILLFSWAAELLKVELQHCSGFGKM